jgi:hypothetical protein
MQTLLHQTLPAYDRNSQYQQVCCRHYTTSLPLRQKKSVSFMDCLPGARLFFEMQAKGVGT